VILEDDLGELLDQRNRLMLETIFPLIHDLRNQLDGSDALTAAREFDFYQPHLVSLFRLFTEGAGQHQLDEAHTQQLMHLILHSGRYFSLRGMWTDNLRWSLELYKIGQAHHWGIELGLLNHIGNAFVEHNAHEQAIYWFDKLIRVGQFPDDHPLTAQTYVRIAGAYLKVNKLDEAFSYASKALLAQQAGDDHELKATGLLIVAQVALSAREREKALGAAQQSLKHAVATNDAVLIARTLWGCARIALANRQFDEARAMYQQALDFFTLINDDIEAARIKVNYAALHRVVGDIPQADQFAREALAVFLRYDLPEVASAQEMLALIHDPNLPARAADSTNPSADH
jgi:tetratricopeptide (TPR) repeat protein